MTKTAWLQLPAVYRLFETATSYSSLKNSNHKKMAVRLATHCRAWLDQLMIEMTALPLELHE